MAFDPSAIDDTKKLILTLDSSDISEDQIDFPLTIHLDGTDILHEAIFTELNGQTFYGGTDPINHWTFDNVSGSTVTDEMGNDDGTLVNVTPTTDGKFDDFLECSGGADSTIRGVEFASDITFKTMSLWVRRNDLSDTESIAQATGGGSFGIRVSSLGNYLCVYGTSWVYSTLAISDTSTWHHVVIREGASAGDIDFFLDGVLDTVTSDWGMAFGDLGRGSTASAWGVPDMDNVQVYDVRLSDADVIKLSEATQFLNKRISIEQGSTQLPVEIENWDKTNELATLHTKVPTYASTADGELVLSFDSSQDDNTGYIGVTGSTPAQSVWDSNFKAVYHMAQDPSGGASSILDSTGAVHLSPTNMDATNLVSVDTLKGIEFNGTNEYLDTASEATLDITDTLTIDIGFVPATLWNSSDTLWRKIVDRQGSDDSYLVGFDPDSGRLHFGSFGGSTQTTTSSWTADTPYLATTTYNSTGLVGSWFVDGVEEVLANDSLDTMAGLTTTMRVGAQKGTVADYFDGILYELRISDVVRSDDWITLTYLSLTDALITWTAVGTGAGYSKPTSSFSGFPSPYKTTFSFYGFHVKKNNNLLPKYPTFGGS